MAFQPLTALSNPGTIRTGSFQPLSSGMSTNPGYTPPAKVQTPQVGNPLVSNIESGISNVGKTIQNVIQGIHFTFTQPTIQSPIPQSQVVKPTQPTSQTVQTPQVGKPLQPIDSNSAQLNSFDPNSMNSVTSKIAQAIIVGGAEVKQNLIDLAMAFPGNLTPENKQTPSEKRGLQLMQAILFGGGGVSNEGIDTATVLNNTIAKLTKNVSEIEGNPQTFVVASKDLQSMGNSATNDLLKSLNLSDSELTAIRKASIGNQNVAITIPPKTIIQVADKPWFSKLKAILNKSSTTTTTTIGGQEAQTQGLAGLLSSGEHTPQDVINTVFKNQAEDTADGKAIIKAASQAQSQGQNIVISKDGESSLSPTSGTSEIIPSAHEARNYVSAKDFANAIYSAKPEQQIGLVDPTTITPRDPVDRQSAQYQALKADIQQNGIQEPIRIDATTDKPITVDGSQRVSVAQDLGIKVPVIVNKGSLSGLQTIKDIYDKADIQNEKDLSTLKDIQKNVTDSQLVDTAKTLQKYMLSKSSPYKLDSESGIALSNALHADNLDTFTQHIKTLSDKYGGDFSDIYNAIKSGTIDEKTYGTFKESLNKENSLNQGTNNQVAGNTKTETNLAETTSPESRQVIKSSANERASSNVQTSNSNAGNAANTQTSIESGRTISSSNSKGSESSSISEPELGSVTLRSEIIPGLSKFFEEDIIPGVKTLGEAAKEINQVINPPKASDRAMKIADLIRKAKSEIDNYSSIEHSKAKKALSFFNKHIDQSNIENISQYERTGTFASEPFKGYSALYKSSLEAAYQVLLAAYGKEPESFIENYVRRAFQFGSKADEEKGQTVLTNFYRSLSGNKSPLKQRVLDMPLDEALQNMRDRGIKVKMSSTNPEVLRQWSLVNAKRAMAYAQVWKEAKAQGLISFVRKGAEIPEGFVRLNDRAAEVFAPAELHYGVKENVSKEGYQGVVSVGRYYADPKVARIFNNAISNGLEGSATFRGVRVIENMINQFQLGISGFHFLGSAINAGVSETAIGLRDLLHGDIIGATKHITIGSVPFASFTKDLYLGRKLINDLKSNSPQATKFLEEKLNPAGGRVTLDQRYRLEGWQKLDNAIVNGNYIGAALRLPQTFVELVGKPLMGYAIPRVKLGAFMELANSKLSYLPKDATNLQKQKALISAWDSIDNRFGQLVYDNLFWNKIVKDLSMLVTRSVGWNLGTIRELGGAVVDAKEVIRGKGISDRMLYAAALVFQVAFLGAVYMYLHTGTWPQSLKDYFNPKNGLTDANGNPDRRNLPTYMKDVFAYLTDPVATVFHKSSPVLDMISSLLTNKDYYGNLVRNPNDPVGTQLSQVGSYVMGAIMPFSIQQFQNALKNGANPEQLAESFFGIIKAPSSVIQSDQQKALIKAYQAQVGLPGPKTPEQTAIQNLKTQAYSEIKSGMGKNSPAFRELIRNGTLNTSRKQQDFLKAAKLTSIQRMASHLPKATRKGLGFK